jgi:hypothetical protein
MGKKAAVQALGKPKPRAKAADGNSKANEKIFAELAAARKKSLAAQGKSGQ